MTNATLPSQPRETCTDRHLNQPSPCPRGARFPRRDLRGAPRLSARTCQGSDVLGCVHTIAGSGEADARPHANRPSTPVTVRFSDSTGLPTIPDNDPARSARGASQSASTWANTRTPTLSGTPERLPVRTGEEFLEFIRAAAAFGAGRPEAFRAFLADPPNAKRFIEGPKPIPTSFTRSLFCGHGFRVHQRRRAASSRAVPHPA